LKSLNSDRHETGRYFQNRFQAKLIDSDAYLITVCGYIHLNPVKANLVRSAEQWAYSNYLEFLGKRHGTLWDQTFFNQYIQHPANYEQYLRSKYTEEGLEPYTFEEN
jgi:putative transposase